MLLRTFPSFFRHLPLSGRPRDKRNCRKMTAASIMIQLLWFASMSAQEDVFSAEILPRSAKARYIVGFDHVRKNTDGVLEFRDGDIFFISGSIVEHIRHDQLAGAFLGTERAEKGGTAGRIARFAVPYGGGTVLGAVSEKEVGILTIDFRDSTDGLHSAVFVMKTSDAAGLQRSLEITRDQHYTRDLNENCQASAIHGAVAIAEIEAAPSISLPKEYRAIMYEHLLSLSEDKTHTPHLIRTGDSSAACAPLSLSLRVVGLSKGNAAVRASSGPIGLFAGVTSVSVHVTLTDREGRIIFDSVAKGTRRGDKESLNAAISVADKIGKDLRRAQTDER